MSNNFSETNYVRKVVFLYHLPFQLTNFKNYINPLYKKLELYSYSKNKNKILLNNGIFIVFKEIDFSKKHDLQKYMKKNIDSEFITFKDTFSKIENYFEVDTKKISTIELEIPYNINLINSILTTEYKEFFYINYNIEIEKRIMRLNNIYTCLNHHFDTEKQAKNHAISICKARINLLEQFKFKKEEIKDYKNKIKELEAK